MKWPAPARTPDLGEQTPASRYTVDSTFMDRRLFLRNATVGAISLGFGSAEDRPAQDSTDTLAQSMRRAAKCCLAWLNPGQNYFPTGGWEVAHDTGRWWDAMLRWEAATQSMIPSLQEMAMLRNIEDLTANPGALLTNTARTGAPPQRIVTTLTICVSRCSHTTLWYVSEVPHGPVNRGTGFPLRWQGPYLAAGTIGANTAIELEYDLPERKSVELMRLSGRKFELSWRGDEVVSCSPEVPIYPPTNRG